MIDGIETLVGIGKRSGGAIGRNAGTAAGRTAPDAGGREDIRGDGREAGHGDIRIHATVSGLVQGVGYRYFAYQAARTAGVTGWVRNLWSGEVEVEAQGARSAVAAFISRLKVGPRWGHVDAVAVDEIDVVPGEGAFRVVGDAG